MQTSRISVAPGVDLAVDAWAPDVVTGPPFLLVHGLASNARMWDGVAVALAAAGHRVAAVDLRGHGRSDKPDGPYDVRTVADDLATLIQGLSGSTLPVWPGTVDGFGAGRPVVAGQSWGGNVVLELAARHPDLVRGIACVDGGWLELADEFTEWDACRAALTPPRLAGRRATEVEAYVRSAHPDWPATGIRGVMGNFEVRADGTVAPWLTFERHITVLRGLWEHRPSERYAGIGVPVLLAPADGGDAERGRRKRNRVDEAARVIPRARVRWFTGDHDIHAQRPDELAGVMHAMTTDGFFA